MIKSSNLLNKFEHTGIREFGDFSDAEIRLKKVDSDTRGRISETLSNTPHIANFDLVGNYLNINFSDEYLRKLFLELKFGEIKNDSKIIIEFFSPNPGQNIHIGVMRNLLLGGFITNTYRNHFSNVRTETMICDSGTVYDTLTKLALRDTLLLTEFDGENPLLHLENEAKLIVKNKDFLSEVDPNQQSESAAKIREFSLKYFRKNLERLGLNFDRYRFQSDLYEIDSGLLEKILHNFETHREKDGLGIILQDRENPQMLINQNGLPTYLFRELHSIIDKYQDGYKEQVFVVGTDQKHHFEVITQILSIILPDLHTTVHFHSMIVCKDGKNKQSAKQYTASTISNLIDFRKFEEYLEFFSKDDILLLHLISDIFLAKKDKEVVFTGSFHNYELVIRVLENYKYLRYLIPSSSGYNIGIRKGIILYNSIAESIGLTEPAGLLRTLVQDYRGLKFQSEIEIQKFIEIYERALGFIGITPKYEKI